MQQNRRYGPSCLSKMLSSDAAQVAGTGLTIVTIGATSCVTILSRDAFSNLQDAFWVINISSSTSTTTLITNASRSAQGSYVMCYPPDFGCSQVGILSVFVAASARELPQLVGSPNGLSYVSNIVCASKCVISGAGLSVGEHY